MNKHKLIHRSMSCLEKQLNNNNIIDVSLCGCGFLGVYHFGALLALEDMGYKVRNYYGTSAGALVAAVSVSHSHLSREQRIIEYLEFIEFIHKLIIELRSSWFGPIFNPNFKLLEPIRALCKEKFNDSSYKLASGQLFICMTTINLKEITLKDVLTMDITKLLQPYVVSTYTSNEELIDALICSSFVPLLCGVLPPIFNNKYCIDGGLTDNFAQVGSHRIQRSSDDPNLITISPFVSECDICPRDHGQSLKTFEISNQRFQLSLSNLKLFKEAFYPKPNVNNVIKQFLDGYNDTIMWKKHIQHYSISSTVTHYSNAHSARTSESFDGYSHNVENLQRAISSYFKDLNNENTEPFIKKIFNYKNYSFIFLKTISVTNRLLKLFKLK